MKQNYCKSIISESRRNLYVYIPKLSHNVVIILGSVKFRFDLKVDGHANNTVVNNVGGILITRMKIPFGGETIQDLQKYDLLKTYEDLYLPVEEREDRLIYGISSVNMSILRTNAGDKVTSDASQVSIAIIYDTIKSFNSSKSILTA